MRLLRRGYNFTDGNDALGRLDAGLFFLAFVRDPRTHFIPMQTTLSSQDTLMEYLTHTGSGLFAVPPGIPEGALVARRRRHARDHRRQPVRRAAAVRLTGPGSLARVTTTPPAGTPVRTPPDAGTPTRVWLVALLTVLCLELVRASGPLLDRAFAAGVVNAAVTALGTYAGAGVVAALLLLATRRTSGTPDARTLLVGSAVLAALRLVLQALDGAALFVVGLVAVAVAVGVLTLAVAFVAGRPAGGRQAAIGLVLGCGLSVGLQLVLGTWDAVWRDGWTGWVVAVVLALGVVATARGLVAFTAADGVRGDRAPPPALGARPVPRARRDDRRQPRVRGVAVRRRARLGGAGRRRREQPRRPVPAAARPVARRRPRGRGRAAGRRRRRARSGSRASPRWWPSSCSRSRSASCSRPRSAPTGRRRAGSPGRRRATLVVGLGTIGPLLLYMLDYDVPLPVDNVWVMVLAALGLALSGLRRRTPGRRPRADQPGPAARAA